METWGVVFLGVIAVALVVQAGFMVALALAGIRLTRRLDALQAQLEGEIAPALKGVERISRNAAEISDLATIQARRIDLLLADTIEKVEDTATVVQKLVIRPLRPLVHLFAVLRGLQRGVDVFLELERRDRAPAAPPPRRPSEDDEHLFI
jgi:hypothetical protein